MIIEWKIIPKGCHYCRNKINNHLNPEGVTLKNHLAEKIAYVNAN